MNKPKGAIKIIVKNSTLNSEEVIKRCDENTIGVVPTLGVTYTCQYEPVKEIADALGLKNVKAEQIRAENVKGEFDFIVSRAVTKMDDFVNWTRKKIAKKQRHEIKNGILYLKGGDLTDELANFPKATLYNLTDYFKDPFFETKKVVHIPLKYKQKKS